MSSVRVAVRVRPLNTREKQLSSKVIIHMKGNTTSIHKPSPVRLDKLKDRGKTFSYDFSFDSTDGESPTFASQEKIFQDLGTDVLKAAFKGFNTCVFAYGQTGSGKSYTMMGRKDDKGLIPRICEGLFFEISRRAQCDAVSFHTEVSYLEIYNERVLDLLRKRTAPADGGGLRVREHPSDGPYVENLSKHSVDGHGDMEQLIALGNGNRTTACTGMNDFSSRSHAIFTITFTQAWFDEELPRETLSKIHLVDLAGSERAGATRTTGTRLKEGANINKSLVTLGSVISALADLGLGGQTNKKKQIFIPYRDSALTWLLKDSLGGNAVTTMIATVSPADVNYTETLSTLRYACRAKNIVNTPTVNEEGSVKVIRELQAEVTRLRKLLEEATQVSRGEPSSSVKVEEKLRQNEAKVVALTKEWTSKWMETQSILQEEAVALRKEGSGVVLDCQLPHLIGIDENLLSAGIILYYLKEGRTLIGSDEASCSQDIVLHGLLREHCVLENCAGAVTLLPQDGALCSVNGSVVTDPCQLSQGAIIQLGGGTIFRFNHPTQVSQLRGKKQCGQLSAFRMSLADLSTSAANPSKVMPPSPRHLKLLNDVFILFCPPSSVTPRHHPFKRRRWAVKGGSLSSLPPTCILSLLFYILLASRNPPSLAARTESISLFSILPEITICSK
ncbi:kinesin-like protein KIF16B isoform X2 [Mugil cephalus]|uniref:kinesin-like protein KIF16B isoform X2 n=1 Tax=Mugil cephalus TaxID=48193 RepID=UPI001FB830AA|nr:kinesin-like protein KIF16B isoform X2 [Mugil cephalus]